MDNQFDDQRRNLQAGKPREDTHLSDEMLLLAVDGELPSREVTLVKEHLEACWSCRARRDRIEKSISDLVEYRSCLQQLSDSPSRYNRGIFVARLQECAEKVGRPSLLSRLMGTFRAWSLPPGPVRLAAALIAALIFFVGIQVVRTRTVSADVLLAQAQVSENQALRTVAKPIIYRRVHIRSGPHSITRRIYRDPVAGRQADYSLNGEGEDKSAAQAETLADNAALQRIFEIAELDWNDPLSAASFRAWRERTPRSGDRVKREGADFLKLQTTTLRGAVTQATLTVRARDFHPVDEAVVLHDQSKIEITEMAFEVLSLDAIDPTIFGSQAAPALAAASPRTSRTTKMDTPSPSESDLAESELRVRLVLHTARADLGEQIEITRNGDNLVAVRGITATADRKQELLTMLAGIPHLDLRLQTAEDSASDQPTVEPPRTATVVSAIPMEFVQRKLDQRFHDPQDRIAFVNQAMALSENALAHAWALRRLRDHYTGEEVARLSPSSTETLELMVRDHVTALRQNLSEEMKLIGTLLPPDAPAPTVAASLRPESDEDLTDWRATVAKIFPTVQKMHEEVATLLAGSNPQVGDADTLTADLQAVFRELNVELPLLSLKVQGRFL